jgi:glycosyltransferase involved in cell wall biosynthesis
MPDTMLERDRTLQARGEVRRIAILSHAHPSISKGGAEVAAYTLYNGLRAIGVDAAFIAACPIEQADRVELATVNEVVVPFDGRNYDHYYHLAAPDVSARVTSAVTGFAPDAVVANHFFNIGINSVRTLIDRETARVGVVLHEFLAICHHHGQMVKRPTRVLCERSSPSGCAACFPEASVGRFIMRRRNFLDTLSRAHAVISPSRFLAGRFAEWGLDERRLQVIENGLAETPVGWRERAVKPEGEPWVFGYFGQINPFKGVELLLRAAEQIAQDKALASRIRIRIHGNLVGNTPEFEERFAKMVRTLPFLEYAGAYSNEQVDALMRRCDYAVMTSVWWENSPLVIQEAYAAGLPVICGDIGGMAEKVHNGLTGLHYRAGDHAALLRAMVAAADPVRHEALCGGLPATVTAEDMARAYVEALSTEPEPAAGRAAPLRWDAAAS